MATTSVIIQQNWIDSTVSLVALSTKKKGNKNTSLHTNFYVKFVFWVLYVSIECFNAFLFKIDIKRLEWNLPDFLCYQFVRNWIGSPINSDSLWRLRSKSHPIWQLVFQSTSQSHFQWVLQSSTIATRTLLKLQSGLKHQVLLAERETSSSESLLFLLLLLTACRGGPWETGLLIHPRRLRCT